MEVEMQYKYVAYNQSKQLVNGKVDAPNETVAQDMLTFSGLKTVSLKVSKPLLDMNKIRGTTYKIKNKEIIMFSKQLALMIESGFDIAASLDLLESQIGDRNLKKVVGEITSDIRNGLKPSQAFAKHPVAFSSLYCRTIAVAEETGNLEKALRQMADHIEKNANSAKKVKGALMYPAMVSDPGRGRRHRHGDLHSADLPEDVRRTGCGSPADRPDPDGLHRLPEGLWPLHARRRRPGGGCGLCSPPGPSKASTSVTS